MPRLISGVSGAPSVTLRCVERRDSLGRRIGHNWWREWNTTLLFDATLEWERRRDAHCIGYETEERHYEREHPRPNLKELLILNAGMSRERAA